MSLDLHSHRSQLVLTALAASVLTASAFSAYQTYLKRQRRRTLDQDILRSLTSGAAGRNGKQKDEHAADEHEDIDLGVHGLARAPSLAYDEELVREQLARNYAFFGDDGMERIRKSSVVVVGCGGVGSWAAVMLARSYVRHVLPLCSALTEQASGVGKIRLVDFDQVTLSSLNRHATAVLSDVGTPKVRCIERTLKQISRVVEVDARIDIWRKESGGDHLEGVDWVIGAWSLATIVHVLTSIRCL